MGLKGNRLTLHCPNSSCGKSFEVSRQVDGQKARCKSCNALMIITSQGAVAVESALEPSRRDTNRQQNALTLPIENQQPHKENSDHARLGRFELLQKCGAGGFGTVYRAHDTVLDRIVALKVPHTERVQSEKAARRFLREAKTAARLTHPNIVPVFDAGKTGNTYFIASGFVEGKSLDQVIAQNGPLPFHQAADIVVQLAEALAYAHRQKIVHRDIKPHNVMLDDQGMPHLMDFGLARMDDEQEKLTKAGTIMGSPAYMSPEQASSVTADQVGPLSDQYSLSALLYEVLTGQPPFHGPVEIVIYQVRNEEPSNPRSLRKDLPKDLETVCLKALSKQPEQRYKNCGEFAADLRRWQEDRPIIARPVTSVERLYRWLKRNPLVGGLTLAIVVVSVLGFIVSASALGNALYQEQKARQAATDAAEKEQEARKQKDVAEAESARAEKNAENARAALIVAEKEKQRAFQNYYVANLNLAQRDWQLGEMNNLQRRLDRSRPDHTGGEDLRGVEWYHWDNAINFSDLQTLSGMSYNQASWNFMVSPDGKYLVSGQRPPHFTGPIIDDVHIWNLLTLEETGTSGITSVSFEADSKVPICSVAISPDSQLLAACDESGRINIWELASSTLLNSHQIPPTSAADFVQAEIAFSPDGKRLAVAFGQLMLWDLEAEKSGNRVVTSFPTVAGHVPIAVDFHPAGKHLTVSYCRVQDRRIFPGFVAMYGDQSTDLLQKLETESDEVVWQLAHHPHSDKLLTNSESVPAEGQLNSFNQVTQACDLKIWDLKTLKSLYRITKAGNKFTKPQFSPDGQTFTAGHTTPVANVWNCATGRIQQQFRGHTSEVHRVCYSPEGQSLYSCSGSYHYGEIKKWSLQSNEIALRSEDMNLLRQFQQQGGMPLLNLADMVDLEHYYYVNVRPKEAGDYEIVLTQMNTGEVLKSVTKGKQGIYSMSRSQSGNRLVVITRPDKRFAVTRYDLEQASTQQVTVGDEYAFELRVSSDGDQLGAKVYSKDPGQHDHTQGGVSYRIKIWSLNSGKVLHTSKEFDSQTDQTQLLEDLQVVSVGPQGENIKLWNLITNTEKIAPFNPETGDDPVSKRSDHVNGMSHYYVLGYHAPTEVLAIRMMNRMAGQNRLLNDRIFLLNTNSGQPPLELHGHVQQIRTGKFSPDGQRFATVERGGTGRSQDDDATLRIWDVSTGVEVMSLELGQKTPMGIQFRPDGLQIVIAFHDGTIKIVGGQPKAKSEV